MEYEVRKHNKPIAVVIKGYLDKQGGKVTVSRNEINWRFNSLDWRHQKQILFAFLQSGQSDRNWAYKKLFAFWDDCFIPTLLDLWEKYHEEALTWLIIRYFPIDFLKSNFNKLNEGRNYFYLCTRLHDTTDFKVDKTRLNECDLLRIKRLLGESTTLADAEDLFYLIVYKYCKGAYKFRAWRTLDNYKNAEKSYLAILNRPLINKMLFEIENFGLKGYDLIIKLRGWRETVTNDYLASHEVAGETYWKDEYEEYLRNEQKTFCYKYIDKEYTCVWDSFDINDQQKFLDYMEERHKLHVLEESVKKNELSTANEITGLKKAEDLFMFFPTHFDYLDEEDDSDHPF